MAALLAFPVLGALFSEHLPHGEVGGLPLLAALGSFALSGYAGHFLAGRAHFDGESLLQACAALSRCLLFAAPSPGNGTDASGEPPPPVLPPSPPTLPSTPASAAGCTGSSGPARR